MTASPAQAQEVHTFLRRLVARSHGDGVARVIRILYGGSVNPGNAAELIAQPHVDGLFIGRSAWQAEGYIDILRRASEAI